MSSAYESLVEVAELNSTPTAAPLSEVAVLSHLMSEPWAIFKVRGWLSSNDFTGEGRRRLYEQMLAYSDASKQFTGALTDEGQVQPYDMALLLSGANATEVVEAITLSAKFDVVLGTVGAHIDTLRRKTYRRRMMQWAEKVAQDVYDASVLEEDIEFGVFSNIANARFDEQDRHVLSPAERMENVTQSVSQSQRGEFHGVPTGFKKLDDVLGGGFYKGDYVVLTAVTGGFKTTFAQSMAEAMSVQHGKQVLYVSLEMPDDSLSLKDLSRAGLTIDKMRSKDGMTEEQIQRMQARVNVLSHAGYYSWPWNGSIAMIQSLVSEMKLTIGLDVVIVDYLQLVESESKRGSTLYSEVTAISSGLRLLARRMDVVVVALAQMSRAIYSTADMLPQTSFLKESGSIENDASAIIGLYWPWAVERVKGKHVPSQYEPWSEQQWILAGALVKPALEKFRTLPEPPVHELQAHVLKHRMGNNRKVVRTGVIPAHNRVFCPFTSTEELAEFERLAMERPARRALRHSLDSLGMWDQEPTLSNRYIQQLQENQAPHIRSMADGSPESLEALV